ncbi:hypothetical protein SVAN01_01879 [Stagonosporopsis vannaccii]|nr:hypothetical protein SVAN01_01879 [Stagonosporopsis vannaccii]
MSLTPIGLQASVGQPSRVSSRTFYSREEQTLLAAREYRKAFERLRQEEEQKRQEKEERRRRKQTLKARAKAQTKDRTLKAKRCKILRLKTYVKKEEVRKKREAWEQAYQERKVHRKKKRAAYRAKANKLINTFNFRIAHKLSDAQCKTRQ